MNNYFKENSLSIFQKQILTMFKGTFIGQIIGFIGTLALAKLYGESAYGIFGVFISFSGLFSILNTFQLEQCIITIRNNKERKNLINSIFLIILITSIIITFLVFIISHFFENITDKISVIILSILFSIAFSFNKTNELYLTFKERFKKISKIKVLLIILNLFFQIVLFNWFKVRGLIYGSLTSIILIAIYYNYLNRSIVSSININLLKKSIRGNTSIVVHLFPSTLINNIAINILPVLITVYFGFEFYGVYFLSVKILSTPLFLINSSVAQVYYKKASKLLINRSPELYNTTKNVVFSNTGLMLFFLVLINTIGIYILELVLNKSWENLKLYTLILSFLILAKSAYIPISDILIVLKKNYMNLIFNCYLLIINFSGLYIGHINNSINLSLILITIFGSIGYMFMLNYSLKEIRNIF